MKGVVFEYDGVRYRTVDSKTIEFEDGRPFNGNVKDIGRKYLRTLGIEIGNSNTHTVVKMIEKNSDTKATNTKDYIKILNDFIYDIDCLDELSAYTNDPTIFEILKIDQMEIRHSNFLAWLINPAEKHGLGDKFIKKMILETLKRSIVSEENNIDPIDIEISDYSDLIVYRERNDIDILAVSENNNIVFAIENKINTGEHSNQLNKYLTYISETYPNMNNILVYLTPEGEDSSNPDKWINLDYGFIVNTIESLIKNSSCNEKMSIFINDYIKTVRRHIVGDDEIREKCKKIYLKHKDALDLIYEYKPDFRNDLSDYIKNYLQENSSRFNITVLEKDCNKTYVRFIPNLLKEDCIGKGDGWVSDEYILLFEIKVSRGKLKIVIGPSEDNDLRKCIYSIADSNRNIFTGCNKNLTGKWTTIFSINIYSSIEKTIKDTETEDLSINDFSEHFEKNINALFENKIEDITEKLKVVFD